MAASTGFSTPITGQTIWSKRAANSPPITVTVNTSLQLRQAETKIAPEPLYMKRVIKRKPKRPFIAQASGSGEPPTDPPGLGQVFPGGHMDPGLGPGFAVDQIKEFYDAINKKEFEKLDKLLGENCSFEDLTFPKPFEGKEEVKRYLEKLMACMRQQDMEFKVEHIFEDLKHLAVAVIWHLEWNNIPVPFTKGCSHYKIGTNAKGDKLIIENALVIPESRIKLGACSSDDVPEGSREIPIDES